MPVVSLIPLITTTALVVDIGFSESRVVPVSSLPTFYLFIFIYIEILWSAGLKWLPSCDRYLVIESVTHIHRYMQGLAWQVPWHLLKSAPEPFINVLQSKLNHLLPLLLFLFLILVSSNHFIIVIIILFDGLQYVLEDIFVRTCFTKPSNDQRVVEDVLYLFIIHQSIFIFIFYCIPSCWWQWRYPLNATTKLVIPGSVRGNAASVLLALDEADDDDDGDDDSQADLPTLILSALLKVSLWWPSGWMWLNAWVQHDWLNMIERGLTLMVQSPGSSRKGLAQQVLLQGGGAQHAGLARGLVHALNLRLSQGDEDPAFRFKDLLGMLTYTPLSPSLFNFIYFNYHCYWLLSVLTQWW